MSVFAVVLHGQKVNAHVSRLRGVDATIHVATKYLDLVSGLVQVVDRSDPRGLQPALVLRRPWEIKVSLRIRQKSLPSGRPPIKAQDAMKFRCLKAKKPPREKAVWDAAAGGQRRRSVSPALRQRSSRVCPAPEVAGQEGLVFGGVEATAT